MTTNGFAQNDGLSTNAAVGRSVALPAPLLRVYQEEEVEKEEVKEERKKKGKK